MANGSKVFQLHTTLFLHFVSTTLPSLNPKRLPRAIYEYLMVGLGNVTPIAL